MRAGRRRLRLPSAPPTAPGPAAGRRAGCEASARGRGDGGVRGRRRVRAAASGAAALGESWARELCGPGGAERLRRGKLAGAQSARPACARLLLAAGKGARASGRQRGTSRGARTVLNSGVSLPEHYFEQGSVTRGSSSCRKLEFLGGETSYLRGHLAGARASILINSSLFFPSKE